MAFQCHTLNQTKSNWCMQRVHDVKRKWVVERKVQGEALHTSCAQRLQIFGTLSQQQHGQQNRLGCS